jgi:ABC-2 type transport system permease protein
MYKFPALLRAAWLDALAYRGELLIWMLAGALPLVMLGVWLPLAEQGLIGSYTPGEFVAYYVGALTVRQFTGVWVIWDMEREIRLGELSPHLLRPVHPLLRYLAMAMSDKPLRTLVALPIFAGTMLLLPWARPPFVPLNALALPLALMLAFALYFTMQCCIGLLSFWITQVIAIQELWFGIYSLASGFLIPLDLFPAPVTSALRYLPFRGMLAFPLALLLGRLSPAEVAEGLLLQLAWAAFFCGLMLLLWQRGLRQYSAVGA